MDDQAPSYFNLSHEGFWRSFLYAAALTPMVLLVAWPLTQLGAVDEGLPPPPAAFDWFILGSLEQFAIIAIYPMLLIPLTRFLGLPSGYVTFVIGWNWSTVVALVLFAPLGLISVVAPGLGGVIHLMWFFMLVTQIYYGVILAKLCLNCNTFTAAGFVALDYAFGLFVRQIF